MDNEIKKTIANSYNKNSESRNHNNITDWKMDEAENFIMKINALKFKSILDLGSGSGVFAEYFKDKGFTVKCIDISEGMINLCLKRGLDAEIMDFYNMTFRDQSFQSIWSMNTLLHVPKVSLKNVLNEIKRVLKNDGIFYLGFYGGRSSEGIWEEDIYKPNRYFSSYEDDEIKRIIKEIFVIEKFKSKDVKRNGYRYQSMLLRKT